MCGRCLSRLPSSNPLCAARGAHHPAAAGVWRTEQSKRAQAAARKLLSRCCHLAPRAPFPCRCLCTLHPKRSLHSAAHGVSGTERLRKACCCCGWRACVRASEQPCPQPPTATSTWLRHVRCALEEAPTCDCACRHKARRLEGAIRRRLGGQLKLCLPLRRSRRRPLWCPHAAVRSPSFDSS